MKDTTRRLLKRFIPPALRPPIKSVLARRRRIATIFAGLALVVSLAIAAVLRSFGNLLAVLTIMALAIVGLAIELRRGRRNDAEMRNKVAALQRTVHDLTVALLSTSGIDTASIPKRLAPAAAKVLLDRGDALAAHDLLTTLSSLTALEPVARHRLWVELKRRGYLRKALEVASACSITDGQPDTQQRRANLAGEIAVLSGGFVPTVRPEEEQYVPRPGRVLHVVGTALPHTQSGYTLRTHYTAVAQAAAGLEPHVVTQMGYAHEGEDYPQQDLDGVSYHRIPGPARGSVPLDGWLGTHVQRVANLVRKVRPAVLHAASDYLNAMTAEIVGKEYGIPVVYESRGFWEETWLSRQAQTFGWDLPRLEATHGLPDVYVWRRDIEDRCRRNADRVVTLADVMADRIEAGGVDRDRITVIPNGVDVDAFPVQTRNRDLATQLGITDDTTVIGYISSIVEYEGIDTLIAAYATIKATTPTPVALLIVGDGPERERLTRQATDLGLDDAIFTGRVPHDTVLDYYSLIDIFVVPRKPVEVCHLVTPLKPFEAFATARTVVLSNVRALTAIAHQSQAAELFEAGDPQSLATTLTKLLHDPHHRHHLAQTGTQWVRTHRTWTANITKYLDVYGQIGAVDSGAAQIQRFATLQVDVAALRQGILSRPSIPFELLSSDDAGDDADQIIETGWSFGNHPKIKLDLPIAWTTLGTDDRSWNFHLHSWDFMGPALSAYSRTGDRRYLDWCVERAASWAQTFNSADAQGTMAWYDMALGLRGHRLAYIVEQAVIHELDSELISCLLTCVGRHQQEYFIESSFNHGTNHGVYVAFGELALARRLAPMPGMEILRKQAQKRIAIMTNNQFADDGGHLEHSPEYHRMLVASFSGALAAGLIDSSSARDRVTRAEEILGWFIQPNGELVAVGDSIPCQMRTKHARTSNATTEFLVSKGRRGKPHEERLRVLPKTGYAIVRSPHPVGTDDHDASSYLLLAAGFHSRTHKHADDLTICWFDRGREILIDAGRYGYVDLLPKDSPQRLLGYFYGSPERQYVESTRAHNTVECDGQDHARRDRKPYGSAVTLADERDNHFRISAVVEHEAWRHEREIVFRPGEWLYVVDNVAATDDKTHDFRGWWNLPAELTPSLEEGSCISASMPGQAQKLWITELGGATPIPPVSAQRDPLRGWRSKQDLHLTPSWSTGFEVIGVRQHQFQTILSFGPTPTTTLENPFAP